jgi:hypothetical protein
VTGALDYEVWASADGGDFEQVGTTTETALDVDVTPETVVEWYVVTTFADCKSTSQHAKFTSRSCGTDAPKLLTPADGASSLSSPVTFTWTPVSGATTYYLWISRDDEDYEVWAEPDAPSAVLYLEPGTYDWYVEAVIDECGSIESDSSSRFRIPRAASCSSAGPILLTPPRDATSGSNVHFSWAPVPGAIHYELWAALDDGDFDFVDETDGTSIDADLGTGDVTWVVVAEFANCDVTLSEFRSLEIPFDPACDTESPFLITPADGDSDVPLHVDFIWTPVYGATAYRVWVSYGDGDPQVLGTTTTSRFSGTLAKGGDITWFVETMFAACPSDTSPGNAFTASASAACMKPESPDIYADPQSMSGDTYLLVWSPGLNTASYEVQESTDANFVAARTVQTTDIYQTLSHDVTVATRYFYRVRSASSCGLGLGPYSEVASTVIVPLTTTDAAAAYGTQKVVVQKVHVPGFSSPQPFTATIDKPWFTVDPASGILPQSGLDFTITASPRDLPVGSSAATLHISTPLGSVIAAGKRIADGPTTGTTGGVPISVNLVTPVTPNAGNPATSASLVIPLLAHTTSATEKLQSDIRVANLSAQAAKYQLNFTPTGADGTKVGQQLTLLINAGETAALNDVLKNFFGYAAATDNVSGVLELRPVSSGSSGAAASATIATSRTYNVGANGTAGTFVPAIPLSAFISRSKDPAAPALLRLQQLAESSRFHTTVGLVEAAGQPATVQLAAIGSHGESLATYTIELKPGEQRQIDDIFTQKGLQFSDARLEAAVTSSTGKVTVFAKVTDKSTGTPVVVTPRDASASGRQVLAGIADFTNIYTKWRSEIRLSNTSSSPATVTLVFYPQSGASRSASVSLAGSESKVLDDVVQTLFGMQNAGGSVAVTSAAPIEATARTYNTAGSAQFVPAFRTEDAAAAGGRALQVLQLEESERFRTNLGLAEIGGAPATVEISAATPESKVALKTQIPLQPNEFMQISRVLSKFGLPTTYNGRVSVRVVGGSGKVVAYASMIDNSTQSPTYIPAQ